MNSKVKPLTKREKEAVEKLKDLAKIWPKSLWLFSASGTLWVMQSPGNGESEMTGKEGGVDRDYTVCNIDIRNDGGDW